MKTALVFFVVASCSVRLSVSKSTIDLDLINKTIEAGNQIVDQDEDLPYNYTGQVKDETLMLLTKLHASSNKDFADALYKFLSQKYETREWVVVVFNDDSHKRIKLANNAFQITLHGRHVIVGSSTKNRKTDMEFVRYELESIPTRGPIPFYPSQSGYEISKWFDSNALYKMIPKYLLPPDSDYSVGVVRADGSDLVIRGPSDRYALVYKKGRGVWHKSEYGGHWMFALLTDKEVKPSTKGDDIPNPNTDEIEGYEGEEHAHNH